MIEVTVLASSSEGNAYQVSDGETNLLLDCGLPIKKIQKGLDFKLSQVDGCLITHSHQDHCKAAKDMLKAGIDIYLSQPTADALAIDGHRVHIVELGKTFTVGSWIIRPFETEHDCDGSMGFYMASKAGRLVYLTDSYYSRYTFKDVTVWMVEVNYDKETFELNSEAGTLETGLRNRVLQSHMSLENAIDLFKANDLSRTEHIYAIHLSKDNANRELIKRRLAEATGKLITIC